MPKIYTDKNVLEAALERYDIIFDNFENVYFSVSGGKDSSVMLQLAARKAREYNRKIDVLYIDLEAQYKATISHIEELVFDVCQDVINRMYWVCLPISLRNAVSILQPKWICWDKKDKDKWVRDMPDNKWVIKEENCPWDWFRHGMEFEEFIVLFAEWYSQQHGVSAAGIAIHRI